MSPRVSRAAPFTYAWEKFQRNMGPIVLGVLCPLCGGLREMHALTQGDLGVVYTVLRNMAGTPFEVLAP